MRELSRAGARWSGVPTVVQRRCCGGATQRGVLGFGSAAKDRDRNAGGFGGPTCGAAEPSACGPSVERSPGISGSGAAGGARGRRKERGREHCQVGPRKQRERERSAGWAERWRSGGGLAAGPGVAHAGEKGKREVGCWGEGRPMGFGLTSFLLLFLFFSHT
jgi:hypothetical protein